MYHKYYSRPILKGAVFEIGKFPPIFDNQLSIARDEMDFVRRTKMGINEIRQLRRCSRSGVCTQSRHPSLLNNLSTISKNDFCIKMTLYEPIFLLVRSPRQPIVSVGPSLFQTFFLRRSLDARCPKIAEASLAKQFSSRNFAITQLPFRCKSFDKKTVVKKQYCPFPSLFLYLLLLFSEKKTEKFSDCMNHHHRLLSVPFRLVRQFNLTMARTEAEMLQKSAEADQIISDLRAKIEQIKAMGSLPPNIQEVILKQENAQLRSTGLIT